MGVSDSSQEHEMLKDMNPGMIKKQKGCTYEQLECT